MATKNIVPRTGSQGGIGTDSKPWKEAIFSTGSFQYISGSLIPDASESWDLGSADKPWKEVYVSTSSINFVNPATGTVLQTMSATSDGFTFGVSGDAVISGSTISGSKLHIVGDTFIGGDLTLGDADTDSISISADLTSNLIPNADATYDLGSTSKGWNDIHLGSGGVINLDGGDVTLTHAAGKITLGGDGAVEFDFANHEMTNVDINSGTINGIQDLAVADGGTGASTLNNLITLGTHTTGNYVATLTAGALIDLQNNSGETASPTVDVDLTEAGEAAIANGDYIIFLDGGATGTHAKEAIADVATLFAGTGLTAASAVIGVDASQTQITSVGTIGTGVWEGTTVAVDQGGTGATSLSNLITLSTHTTGNYVATLTGGTGITSTGATSGEGIAHSISVDASQTQITGVGTVTTGTWNSSLGANTNLAISGSIDAATGSMVGNTNITTLGTIGTGVWQGTEVGLGYGGTELVGETDGKIVVADGSGAPTHLDIGSSSGITILGTVATGTWEATDVAVAHGGTGVSTLTDGGILLGSGTSAVTAMAVLGDGEFVVGDGTTDPVAESGDTARISLGVGSTSTWQITGLNVGHANDTSLTRVSAGDLQIEANIIYRAGGTDVAVADGGTGQSNLNNLITLTTHTTGNYVATITGGTGITSTAATSGEGTTHSLSVDASQTQITAVGTIATGVWQGTDVGVAYGGTGASTLDNLITLGDHTTGNYVGTITGGTGITSTAATSGEGTTHSLSVDAAQTQITSVGALDAGTITSNFGSINNGASAITTTGLISGGSLDIDDVVINGTTIGHTDDTDLLTVANGKLTIAGNLDVTGETTFISSSAVSIGDRIVVLNAGNAPGDGGLYIIDTDTAETGSLLWDVSEDRWIGGLKGAEANVVLINTTDTLTNKTLTTPTIGSFTNATHDHADAAGGGVIALGTATSGNYVGTLTGGTGITSTGATTGEGIVHSISVDAAQTQITSVGTIGTGTWEATDVAVAHGGTGVSTLTDGGVLLGNGTGGIVAMSVLGDSEMIVGDGTTDPVAESGATLRTSIGVGTTDNVLFAAVSASGDISGSSSSTGSFGRIQFATGGGADIPDQVRLNFGDGQDLKIYHSGTHSIIQDSGTGDLQLKGSIIKIRGTSTGENMGVFTEDAATELYYNGTKRFETTHTGVNITGAVTASTIDIDSIKGNWTNAGNTVADLGSITTVDINGGTINGIQDLAVVDGGTGASTLNDLITLGTHTTGHYVATITGGTGITSTAATTGEGTTHSLSIDAAQTQITSVGTIGTGVWQGTDVGVAYGGTGASTFTDGGILFGNGTGAIQASAVLAAGEILIGDGTTEPTILDVGSASGIEVLGTIGTGVWNGTKVASAYLDDDTAHLTTTQTFSGAKSFTLAVNIDATTAASSKTTGALIVDGGVGVALDIHAGGDVVAYASSDVRLKDNLQVIEGSLDKIGQINGYEFDWNEESPEWAQKRGHDIGVVAQEVQKVLPEIVTERTNGYLGVDYKRLIPLLIESIKELKQEVEDLKKKVN